LETQSSLQTKQLESELGKGSTFYFDLIFDAAAQEEVIKEKTVQSFDELKSFEGESILLVEDNKINVMVAKKFLSKWNLLIDVAENGAIALEKVQQKDYSLILMDLNMPVMDGYTATQEIRKLQEAKYREIRSVIRCHFGTSKDEKLYLCSVF